jgi:thioredoxin-like negative regulator of GroEL
MFDFFGGKDPERAYQKAQEYIKEQRIDAAIKIIEGNLTDGEESFDLYLLLARLYFNSEERDRAMQVVRSAYR